MSRDYRHGQKSSHLGRKRESSTTTRPAKGPTKRQQEDTLRHAVQHQDYDPFEDDDACCEFEEYD